MSPRTRLLHLGFAFPPGVQESVPHLIPAGHAFETQMIAALRAHFEIRTVGTLPFMPGPERLREGGSAGLEHALLLVDKPPELWRRYRALARLRGAYQAWRRDGWQPAAVLVYNLSPVYNHFIRWLGRQPARPKLILLLLDSAQLGSPLPRLKRLRYRLKPLTLPDEAMLGAFDGCVGLSPAAARYLAPRATPFLWMPGACAPERAVASAEPALGPPDAPPVRFGYFGALAAHAGIQELVETFLALPGRSTLEVCGSGKLGPALAERASHEPRLRYHGLLPTPDDCLRFGRACDVLINPRPLSHGNANNFPSKVFDYALCARAILSSRMSGVDEVLGAEAYYFDPGDFRASLGQRLSEVAGVPRAELRRRGQALQERVLAEFNWPRQAARIADFIGGVLAAPPAG